MAATQVTLVAALARNGIIGRDQALPWHLPADLARFKRLTLGKPLLLGRRTFASLPGRLPGRVHIVVSGDPRFRAEGCIAVPTPLAALVAVTAPELMVGGGATLYRALLPLATRMYLTWVETEIAGDTYFPAWQPRCWHETAREHRPADRANPYALTFVCLERRAPDDARQTRAHAGLYFKQNATEQREQHHGHATG